MWNKGYIMNYEQAMQALEAAGTAQNRKIYARHGASDNLFGVSYGNLNKLKKQLKVDHDLAQKLWASGNHDARILAMKIADPKQANGDTLESWVRDLGDYVVTDALSEYVSKTGFMREKMEVWVDSDDEWIGTTGWNLLGYLAMKDKKLLNEFFEPYLAIIADDIHNRKNRVRYAMNNALIAIGMRNETLEAQAMEVAAKIGEVMVDHGETSCQTPDAAAYIQRTRARQQA
jgi:3-methyladenine DNA glycosylase AlkD